MCLVCLLLMLAMCLADGLGIPLIRGNPLPESLQAWISRHPEAVICGEVQQCAESEFSQSVYLKRVWLLYQPEQKKISEENNSTKDLSAKESDKTESNVRDSYEKVSIENVRVFLKKEKGKANEKIPAGTLLKVSGRLVRVPETRNPGEFDSRQYYGCRHIYYFMKDGVIQDRSDSYSAYLQGLVEVREHFARIFEGAAGGDAPVFEAMVLGVKGELEEEVKMRYQMAGIIHILAISGMHISLLGAGLNRLLKRAGLGIFLSGMISLVFMIQYGMMTGGSVSAMRAVCMFLMATGAELLGRCYDGMTALAVSALILLLNSPANLYSSGFLLSFGAVCGLGAAPVLCRLVGSKNRIINALLSSAAVQLMTLPVMLYFYGEVSLAGILLNLAVLPTVGAVLASGVAGGLAGLASLKAAGVVIIPGRAMLFLYDKLCILAGKLPWCTWIGGRPELWQIGLYYGLLFLAFLFGKKAGELQALYRRKAAMFAAVLIFAGIFCLGWHHREGLTITCLDVGQGDGIVLETSDGHQFLIDGGSSSKSGVGQYQILPYLKSRGIHCLDAILVSHTDEDHISGIRELLTFMGRGLTGVRAERLILPEWEEKSEAYRELEKLAREAGIAVLQGKRGDVLLAGKLEVKLLAPEKDSPGIDVNEEGMVLEVRYGGFTGLFTGDIGMETEKELLPLLSDVDFLKVAHHGSRYSSGKEFLEKVKAEVGVISCSAANTYGHPAAETVERLEKSGCRPEYTMESGAVIYWTDGENWTVEGWLE
ncbi:MAG: DNA internalization-related competence protein ComEC/Rec2 [Eubacteriales bacterium]|nr:DNA internalization-related competence protein ComEC/Rec2 [Eubacteriales bacterium]